MGFNPLELMKLNSRFKLFEEQHGRFTRFLHDMGQYALREGSIVEMKVTDPEGHEYVTNIKLTPEDIETIGIVKNLK